MSKIEFKKKLSQLYRHRDRIPDEFWVRAENGQRVIWILDQEDGSAGSYETSQERLGLTQDGKVLWGFSSGCSCWGGWNAGNYCETKSYKEFQVSDFEDERRKSGESHLDELNDWMKVSLSTLDDFLLLVSDNPDPLKILSIENAEIRRYMIKRVGYENIKTDVNAQVLHTDGTSELLDIVVNGNKERYVKVKDTSTEREYLLYVPDFVQSCREGIAWTFDLSEADYNPLIES